MSELKVFYSAYEPSQVADCLEGKCIFSLSRYPMVCSTVFVICYLLTHILSVGCALTCSSR